MTNRDTRLLLGLALFAAALTVSAPSARAESAALAALDVDVPNGAVLRLTARVVALTAGRYEGRVSLEMQGPSGSTRTSQGGTVELDAGEAGDIATVGLNVAPGDRLTVTFELRAGQAVVSRSAITLE